ncbi:UNVERIFIED_CONTAM: hypothetical protein K2H54_041516 [Gekko kuhli]
MSSCFKASGEESWKGLQGSSRRQRPSIVAMCYLHSLKEQKPCVAIKGKVNDSRREKHRSFVFSRAEPQKQEKNTRHLVARDWPLSIICFQHHRLIPCKML